MEEKNITEETVDEVAEEVVEETEENVEDAQDVTTEETDKEEQTEETEGKKGFFKKDKKEKKDKKDEMIEELTDKYKRTFAEFDNFRKRSEKERAAMFEVGAKSIVEKILPIVDSFERGLATLSEEDKANPFADGMDKVYKQMVKALEEAGVTPIEAVGKEFDPNLHNAVMHGEDENFGENIIAEEYQKGYMYRDSVVRYSMVKVVN